MSNANGQTQLAPKGKSAVNTLAQTLENAKPHMLQVLPKHLTPERLIKVALVACSKNPKLLACTTSSILQCVMLGAELGLEAGGPLGHLWLVPYKNECTAIIGYQGLVELSHRSGRLLSVESHVVHEKDPYRIKFGKQLILWHTPFMDGDPGAVKFVYAVARLKGGGVQAIVMTTAEVERIRSRSRAGTNGPWVTDWEEMAKKTAVRRLCKMLPKSVRLAKALEAEDEQDAYVPQVTLVPEPLEPSDAPKTRTDSVREQVKAAAAKDGAANEPPPPGDDDAPADIGEPAAAPPPPAQQAERSEASTNPCGAMHEGMICMRDANHKGRHGDMAMGTW